MSTQQAVVLILIALSIALAAWCIVALLILNSRRVIRRRPKPRTRRTPNE